MDLTNYLFARGIPLKKVTAGEWAGACPFCGGRDRFRVWPNEGQTGGYWICRGCHARRGDAIELVRSIENISYPDACRLLEISPKQHAIFHPAKLKQSTPKRSSGATGASGATATSNIATVNATLIATPPEQWQAEAARFYNSCMEISEPALRALQDERGIPPEFWDACGLAFNPRDVWVERTRWGLEPYPDTNGKPHTKLFIPAGIAILTRRKAGIMGLAIHKPRFMRKAGDRKTHIVAGSMAAVYAVGYSGPILVFESALDAALAWSTWKATGRDMIAIATGGSTKPLDDEADQIVRKAGSLFFCQDMDAAGNKAFFKFKAVYRQAKSLCLIPNIKDIGDLYTMSRANPGSIPTPVQWIQYMIESDIPPDKAKRPEEPLPMTKNGTPDYKKACSGYWQECFDCPDKIPDKLLFCRKCNKLAYGKEIVEREELGFYLEGERA